MGTALRALKLGFDWKWDRRTDYKPAAPCLAIEIVAGKCGFAGQLCRRDDGNGLVEARNAIPVLT
jgi:hypothetical protein